jgi:hypothetical protein
MRIESQKFKEKLKIKIKPLSLLIDCGFYPGLGKQYRLGYPVSSAFRMIIIPVFPAKGHPLSLLIRELDSRFSIA